MYRLGDQIGAWSYAGLVALGWNLRGISYAAIPISILWLLNAIWLGRRETRMAKDRAAEARVALATP